MKRNLYRTLSNTEINLVRRPPFKRIFSVVAFVFCFLIVTGRHLSFFQAITSVDATDTYSYLNISNAAPGFYSEPIPYHFAQRFIPHYVVGTVSNLLNCELGEAYYVANILLLAAILGLSLRLLFRQNKSSSITVFVFALMAFSPYAFRLNILIPAMLADLVFVLGLTVCLTGLFEKKLFAVVLGMLFAATGKQMILLVLPGILLFFYSAFRERLGTGKTMLFGCALIVTTLEFNSLLALYSASFAFKNFITGDVVFSVFPWLFSDKFTVVLFLEHIFRVILPTIPFVMLIWAVRERNVLSDSFTLENAALLLIILGPMAYAFLPGPLLQMQNQSRYTASAVFPMALLTLNLLPRVEYQFSRADFAFLAVIAVAYSYHHKYCVFPSAPGVFLGIHLISLAMLLGWLKFRLPALAPNND